MPVSLEGQVYLEPKVGHMDFNGWAAQAGDASNETSEVGKIDGEEEIICSLFSDQTFLWSA